MEVLRGHRFIEGDCFEVLAGIGEGCVAAVVTDPPYGITLMSNRWDNPLHLAEAASRKRVRLRPGAAYQVFCEVWMAQGYRVLEAGGVLCCFGAARMVHRVAAAARAVGFVDLRVGGWCYQTGVPMSIHVEKVVGELAGREAGARFKGYGTALKAAWEAVLVARKPP